ncbi:MAG: hypothetical protein OEY15_13370 [Myxococcales bacterium]|nr:hypothetical protein [Myxococcales bacterium]
MHGSIAPQLRSLVTACVSAACLALTLACGTYLGTRMPGYDDLSQAPRWLTGPCAAHWKDAPGSVLCAVGSAAGSPDASLLRATAIERGRAELTHALTAKITAMLEDHATTKTGAAELWVHSDGGQRIAHLSRLIADTARPRLAMAGDWTSEQGTYFALLAISSEAFSDAVREMDWLSESMRRALIERSEAAFGGKARD